MPTYITGTPNFPTLSSDPDIETWKQGVSSDPTLRSPKSAGLATTRSLFTRVPLTWNFSYLMLSDKDKQTLEIFERDTVKFGASYFYWRSFQEAYGADAWVTGTIYSLGQIIQPTVPNGHSYKCTIAGTSAAPEPTWPTTIYSTVDNNLCRWMENSRLVRFAQPLAFFISRRIDCWNVDISLEEV
jgi:hypothetical protein